jgi:hypothetical protein
VGAGKDGQRGMLVGDGAPETPGQRRRDPVLHEGTVQKPRREDEKGRQKNQEDQDGAQQTQNDLFQFYFTLFGRPGSTGPERLNGLRHHNQPSMNTARLQDDGPRAALTDSGSAVPLIQEPVATGDAMSFLVDHPFNPRPLAVLVFFAVYLIDPSLIV